MSTEDFIFSVMHGYEDMIEAGLPIAFFIAACNIAFNLIITAFSGGRLRFGRGDE